MTNRNPAPARRGLALAFAGATLFASAGLALCVDWQAAPTAAARVSHAGASDAAGPLDPWSTGSADEPAGAAVTRSASSPHAFELPEPVRAPVRRSPVAAAFGDDWWEQTAGGTLYGDGDAVPPGASVPAGLNRSLKVPRGVLQVPDGTSVVPPTQALGPYDPTWGDATPVRTLDHAYDGGLTDAQNGALLDAAVAALLPGDKLVVAAGAYELTSPMSILHIAAADLPIVIEGESGSPPHLYRSDILDGVVEIGGEGTGTPIAAYVVLRGFELSGGDAAVRLHKVADVWIDANEMRDTGGGVAATTEHAGFVHITRNDIHDTQSWGEGIQLGKNSPNRIFHDSVVALNHIHDTQAALQGEGIDMKWRSNANWIVENVIHGTNFPSIKFEATDNRPLNVVERNVCWDSGDNVIQAEGGEAVVRNNVLASPAGNKLFDSSHNSATLKKLYVTHNTMISKNGYGAGLWAWNGQQGLVFANNAVYINDYSANTYAIAIGTEQLGGTIAGNTIFGKARNLTYGWVTGNGLTDLAGQSTWAAYAFDGDVSDLWPGVGSALDASADPNHVDDDDFYGVERTMPTESGAFVMPD